MKYILTNRHVEIFNQLFDFTLKSVGLNGVTAVSSLINLINTSAAEKISIVELNENHIKTINSMSDVVLKSQGLSALSMIMELSSFLNNPLQEDQTEELKEDNKKE